MFKKTIMAISLLIVMLLVVSSVNASDNQTEDIIGAEKTINKEFSVSATDDVKNDILGLEETNNQTNFVLGYCNDEINNLGDVDSVNKLKSQDTNQISVDEDSILSSVNILEKPFTEETYEINYSDSLEFKIDLNGKINTDYVVDVWTSDGHSDWDTCIVCSDNNGDLNFTIHFDPGYYTFEIYENRKPTYDPNHMGHEYIPHIKYDVKILPFYGSTNYANVKITGVEAIFGQDKEICYEWDGLFKGYLRIYKGSKVIDSLYVDNWNYQDMSGYRDYYGIGFLPVGTFSAKIIDMNGNVITQSTIKILKTASKVKISSITAKSGTMKYICADVYDKTEDCLHNGGKVKFNVNGKNYYAKVKEGTAKVKIKVPSVLKTYTCKATFLGDNNAKSSSKTFKITVKKTTAKKTTTKKKTTSFTVVVPVKLNKYTCKTVGEYKVKLHKYLTDYESYQRIDIAINLYKNNKKIKSTSPVYKTKAWFHLKNGAWKYWGVNNYGKLSFNELTYNQYMNVDKAKIIVWVKS